MIITFLISILQKDFDPFLVGNERCAPWLVPNGLLPMESSPKEYFIFSQELTYRHKDQKIR